MCSLYLNLNCKRKSNPNPNSIYPAFKSPMLQANLTLTLIGLQANIAALIDYFKIVETGGRN